MFGEVFGVLTFQVEEIKNVVLAILPWLRNSSNLFNSISICLLVKHYVIQIYINLVHTILGMIQTEVYEFRQENMVFKTEEHGLKTKEHENMV